MAQSLRRFSTKGFVRINRAKQKRKPSVKPSGTSTAEFYGSQHSAASAGGVAPSVALSSVHEVPDRYKSMFDYSKLDNIGEYSDLEHANELSDDNYFSTMNGVIPHEPENILQVRFGRGRNKPKLTELGQELSMSDNLHQRPSLRWKNGEINKFYTIIMVDPDCPDPRNPTRAEYLHWLLLNAQITKDENDNEEKLKQKLKNFPKSANADKIYHLMKYEAPKPEIGSHRYVILIYEQSGEITHFPKFLDDTKRSKFCTKTFVKTHKKIFDGKLVAATFFYVESPEKHEGIGNDDLKTHYNSQNYQLRQQVLKKLREEYGKMTQAQAEKEAQEHIDSTINFAQLIDSIEKENIHYIPNENSNTLEIEQDEETIDEKTKNQV